MLNRRVGSGVRGRALVSVASTLLLTASASAAPTFFSVGFSGAQDISANGVSALGIVTGAAGPTYVKVNFGSPATFVNGPAWGNQSGNPSGLIMGSDDLSVLSTIWYDSANVAGTNCFLGNTVADQFPPCAERYSPHRYARGTWTNLGTFPRFQEMHTYLDYPQGLNVWVGGTRCDSTTFSADDISGDGSTVIGQGYYATSDPRSNGNAPSGICGPQFHAGVWSTTSGMFNTLPTQAGTLNSYAYKCSSNGTVIVGRDNNHLCAWRNTVQTILDPSGYSTNPVITRNGAIIASQMSAAAAASAGFPNAITMAKWTWNGSAWVPTNIGLPAEYVDENSVSHPCVGVLLTGISDDGNTIVGTALHDTAGFGGLQRLFIWRPSINSGVPTDFLTYYRSQLPQGDTSLDGLIFAAAQGTTYFASCSADGNALLTNYQDNRYPGTGLTFEQGVFHLDSVACDQPRGFKDPYDQAIGNLSNVGIVLNYGVSGTWPLQFQWQMEFPEGSNNWVDMIDDHPNVNASGFDYHGSNTSKFVIGHLSGTHFGYYRCVVSNSCGTITSAVAHIDCGTPSVVAPVSKTICAGEFNQIDLLAQAIGTTTLSFQWYKGAVPLTDGITPQGSIIQGSQSTQLTIAQITPTDAGQYSYSAANACASVMSAPGTLTVTSAPTITAQPATVSYRNGDTKYLQVSVNNPGSPNLQTFDFQWRRNGVNLADGPSGNGSTYSGTSVFSTFYGSYFYIHNMTAADEGQYDCVVSGGGCANQVISSPGTFSHICPADLDNGTGSHTADGAVTIDDLLFFLSSFESGSVVADLDDGSGSGALDGAVTVDDLLYMLIHFEAGC